MKAFIKYSQIIAIALLAGFSIMSCDKIPADERRTVSGGPDNWNGQYVLLQDFTGVRCVNCPAAAEEIERLKTIFGDKLIVVGLHPKMLAFNLPYDTVDLRNEQAEDYRKYYQISALPNGIIMQKNEPVGKDNFYAGVLSYYERQAVAEMSVKASISGNKINIETDIAFVENHSGTGTTQLSLMVLEDGLVVEQLTPEGNDKNYIHDHVLRGMATPIWGDEIIGNTASANSTFEHTKSLEINSLWNKSKLSVVAILFDNNTKEVIQCASVKITE